MSDTVLTAQSAVYPWHCDHMGHMNVMWYVGKFEARIGWRTIARSLDTLTRSVVIVPTWIIS